MRKIATAFFMVVMVSGFLKAQLSILPLKRGQEEVYPLRPGEHTYVLTFKLVKGLILVEGQVPGRSGYFIFDTGSPSIIINLPVLEPSQEVEALSLGGQVNLLPQRIPFLEVGNLMLREVEGYEMDLSHLEKELQEPILGLLGYTFFAKMAVVIDYQEEWIQLVEYPKYFVSKIKRSPGEVPFSLVQHLPVLDMQEATNHFRLVLDTGSGVNLIVTDSNQTANIPVQEELLQGVDRHRLTRQLQKICDLLIENRHLPCTVFNLVDVPANSVLEVHQLDGVIGYPLLGYYRVTIDYPRQMVFFQD